MVFFPSIEGKLHTGHLMEILKGLKAEKLQDETHPVRGPGDWCHCFERAASGA